MSGRNAEIHGGQARLLRAAIITGATALTAPAAYVFGRAYREAWIHAHGLPASAFGVSLEDALLWAYVGLIQGAMRVVNHVLPNDWFSVFSWFFAFCILFVAAGIWIFASAFILGLFAAARRKVRSKWRRRRSKCGREPDSLSHVRRGASRALVFAYVAASAPVLFAGIAVYLLLLLALPAFLGSKIGSLIGGEAAQKIGGSQAGNEIDENSNFVYLSIMGGQAYGRLITCGEIGCGVQTEQGAEFVVWGEIKSISSRPHNVAN